MKILNLANGRKQFGEVLKILGQRENNQEIVQISDKLNFIGTKWLGIRGCLIKARLVGLNEKWVKRITEMLGYIASYEEDIANELELIIGKNQGLSKAQHMESTESVSERKLESDSNNGIVKDEAGGVVDLTTYFNNKAFEQKPKLDSKADITGTGDYLLLDGISYESPIQAQVVQYKLFSQKFSEFDNISCDSQTIKVCVKNVKSIGILTCAEWGDFYEKVDVFYSDGSKQDIYFQLNDWCVKPNDTRYYLPVRAVSKKSINHEVDKEPRYISSIVSELDSEKEVVGIQLPSCPNVHIFAISFS